jgi:hypothetical protein
MDQLPESVRNALQTEAKGNQIEELKKETGKNGKVAYEAEVVAGDKGTHLKLDESGKILKRSTHSESKEKEHGKE